MWYAHSILQPWRWLMCLYVWVQRRCTGARAVDAAPDWGPTGVRIFRGRRRRARSALRRGGHLLGVPSLAPTRSQELLTLPHHSTRLLAHSTSTHAHSCSCLSCPPSIPFPSTTPSILHCHFRSVCPSFPFALIYSITSLTEFKACLSVFCVAVWIFGFFLEFNSFILLSDRALYWLLCYCYSLYFLQFFNSSCLHSFPFPRLDNI